MEIATQEAFYHIRTDSNVEGREWNRGLELDYPAIYPGPEDHGVFRSAPSYGSSLAFCHIIISRQTGQKNANLRSAHCTPEE